jgi:hypothetical protein
MQEAKMSEVAQKVWNRASIVALLDANAAAVSKGLWKLYQRQTSTEQAIDGTVERNGRGFTSHDAPFLSDIAKRLPRYDYRLTARQLAHVRPKLRKYWRQFLEEIEAAGGQVDFGKAPKREIANEPDPEAAMQRMEEIADRAGTERDERNKHRRREVIETHAQWGMF